MRRRLEAAESEKNAAESEAKRLQNENGRLRRDLAEARRDEARDAETEQLRLDLAAARKDLEREKQRRHAQRSPREGQPSEPKPEFPLEGGTEGSSFGQEDRTPREPVPRLGFQRTRRMLYCEPCEKTFHTCEEAAEHFGSDEHCKQIATSSFRLKGREAVVGAYRQACMDEEGGLYIVHHENGCSAECYEGCGSGCSRACTLRIEELPADADKLHERLYVLGIREQWQAWFKCQPSEHRAFVLSIAALEEWKIVHSLVP